jgi:hypothetical protein
VAPTVAEPVAPTSGLFPPPQFGAQSPPAEARPGPAAAPAAAPQPRRPGRHRRGLLFGGGGAAR